MNVLAEEQKKLKEKLADKNISDEEKKQLKETYLELYYKMRDKEESRFYNNLTWEQRVKLHKFIIGTYALKDKLGGFTSEIIGNKRTETNRPLILALTHVGKFDIEVISSKVTDPYYLLSGDFEHLQGTIDAAFLGLNGVLYFNEEVKNDRQEIGPWMVNLLKKGANLMYFPEGTWNVKPNLPLLPCYWGIIDVARESNAMIIPIAADQYGKHFKINIGRNFDVNNYEDTREGKAQAITDLRDVLATLKWKIWETEEPIVREELADDYWDKYVSERFKEWPYFSEEYIENLIFKPKDVVPREEVYAPVKKLVPNKNNAFLYDKRLKDNIFE